MSKLSSSLNSKKLPSVIVIGGGANALSIARSLGPLGIRVHALNKKDAAVCSSRYAQRIEIDDQVDYKSVWEEFLIGPEAEGFHGSVLLAASDVGLEIIANNRAKLEERFLLDESNVDAQLAMLDKLQTYELARKADIPTPGFWPITSRDSLDQVKDELVYPLIVKPKSSHAFTDKFKGKFFWAHDFDEVMAGCEKLFDANVDFLLMEMIPGPDDLLCSYYTYLNENGEPEFHFTKRIIRRNPPNMGLGCYHITDEVPEIRATAIRLFQQVGLRGLCNAEFKLDQRDGVYKLIECNARFTEANGLVAKSGFDLSRFVYNRIVGLPQEPLEHFRSGVRLLYPFDDIRSFFALRRKKQLTFFRWLRSLFHWQQFPLFAWKDPMPSVVSYMRRLKNWFKGSKK